MAGISDLQHIPNVVSRVKVYGDFGMFQHYDGFLQVVMDSHGALERVRFCDNMSGENFSARPESNLRPEQFRCYVIRPTDMYAPGGKVLVPFKGFLSMRSTQKEFTPEKGGTFRMRFARAIGLVNTDHRELSLNIQRNPRTSRWEAAVNLGSPSRPEWFPIQQLDIYIEKATLGTPKGVEQLEFLSRQGDKTRAIKSADLPRS
jgi:hypothetical protein